MKIKKSLIFIWWICRLIDNAIRNSRKILEEFLCWNPSVAEVKRRPLDFLNLLQKFSIFRRLFVKFCKNLDASFHIVSKNIMVLKWFRIFVFLNEVICSFFTYSQLQLHFKQKFGSNFILVSLANQCRIYHCFQIRSLIQNWSILSRDIPLFLAQLLQNRRFQEKSKDSKI